MPVAYSYKRFSSEKQSRGDSLRRQGEEAERYIREHPELKLKLDTSLNLTDAGLSAYKNVHLKRGALGVFLRAVEDGAIEEGSYLLVESLDRLSRRQPLDALAQLISLVKSGIVVVTLQDRKIYSSETLSGTDGTFAIMQSLIGMARAHEESEVKSKRLRAVWNHKFSQIEKGKQLTKRVPFWLNPDRSVNPDMLPVVQRIFEEYKSGLGHRAIAVGLNKDGIPSPQGNHWGHATINKTLKGKAVLGILTTIDGKEHVGYYPQVIEEELWAACQLRKGKFQRARDGRVKPLAGLIRCTCGGNMLRTAKGGRLKKDGTRTLWEYLICSRARLGVPDCTYQTYRYQSVLDALMENMDKIGATTMFSFDEMELQNIDTEITECEESLETIYSLYNEFKSEVSRKRLLTEEKRLEGLLEARRSIVERMSPVSRNLLMKLLANPEPTNEWLSKVIRYAVLSPEGMTVVTQNGREVRL